MSIHQRTVKEQWLHDLEQEDPEAWGASIARVLEERHPDLYHSLKAELQETAWLRKLELDAQLEAYRQRLHPPGQIHRSRSDSSRQDCPQA